MQSNVKLKSFLLICGWLLLLSWMYIYANPTLQFFVSVLKETPYYYDFTSAYYFAFVLAPFAAYEYLNNLESIKNGSCTGIIKHYVLLFFLSFFNLILLFLVFAFGATFYDAQLGETSFSEIWFLLSIPFLFLVLFFCLIYFLKKFKY